MALLSWLAMGTMDCALSGVRGALGWLLAGLAAAAPSWIEEEAAETGGPAAPPGPDRP